MKKTLGKLIFAFCMVVLCLVSAIVVRSVQVAPAKAMNASLSGPGAGKTLLMIGQTYTQDYKNYISATGQVPAGGSAYGNIYSGQLDSDSQALVSYLGQTYPGSYVEVGLSIKDAVPASYTSQYGDAAVYHVELDITNHMYDSQIDTLAGYLKSWPQLTFLLRIDYEVSLNIHANTNPGKLDPSSFQPQAYRNMFNYIASRLRATDSVGNVAFVYHPVRSPNDAQELYPGSQYVDWFGASFFNNDVCLDDNGTDNCSGQQLDPPDFSLSSGQHILSLEVESSGVAINTIVVNKIG